MTRKILLIGIVLCATLVIVAYFYAMHNREEATRMVTKVRVKPGIDDSLKSHRPRKPERRVTRTPESKKKSVDTQDYMSAFDKKTSESCITEKVDDRGLVASEALDTDCDGKGDYCRSNFYNEFGDLMESRLDTGCDGSVDKCEKSEYDEYGEMVYSWMGKSCDDISGMEICMSNEYGDDGFLTRQTWDFQCKDKPVLCLNYEYADDGAWTKILRDHECNGDIDSCATFKFNETGQMISVEQDRECDGKPDKCISFGYNADGLLIKKRQDNECGEEKVVE